MRVSFVGLLVWSALLSGSVLAAPSEQSALFSGTPTMIAQSAPPSAAHPALPPAAHTAPPSAAHTAQATASPARETAALSSLSVPYALSLAAHRLVSGQLWDWRYGEAVLGEWGLKYTASTVVTVNGTTVAPSALEKAPGLNQLRGCSGWGRVDAKGQLTRLDLVQSYDIQQAGSISYVRVSRPTVRAGATVELELRAEPHRQASFFVCGLGETIIAFEEKPGIYRCRWKVPQCEGRGLRVLGRLHEPGYAAESEDGLADNGGLEAAARRGNAPATVAVRVGNALDVVLDPPAITSWGAHAAPGNQVWVYANYGSWGAEIAPRNVQFWVGDREVSARFQRTGRTALGTFSRREVPPGTLCCVKVTDPSGKSAKKYWRADANQRLLGCPKY